MVLLILILVLSSYRNLTAIVAIDQLPVVPETLLLRILGRDKTQWQAIKEAIALPMDAPQRLRMLRLVASWKVRMDMGELEGFIQQEDIMAFSAAFLALEQATKLEQSKTIALRMLGKQLDLETIAEVTGLTIEQIQQLQSQAATN
jgi:hypothetical protein